MKIPTTHPFNCSETVNWQINQKLCRPLVSIFMPFRYTFFLPSLAFLPWWPLYCSMEIYPEVSCLWTSFSSRADKEVAVTVAIADLSLSCLHHRAWPDCQATHSIHSLFIPIKLRSIQPELIHQPPSSIGNLTAACLGPPLTYQFLFFSPQRLKRKCRILPARMFKIHLVIHQWRQKQDPTVWDESKLQTTYEFKSEYKQNANLQCLLK